MNGMIANSNDNNQDTNQTKLHWRSEFEITTSSLAMDGNQSHSIGTKNNDNDDHDVGMHYQNSTSYKQEEATTQSAIM